MANRILKNEAIIMFAPTDWDPKLVDLVETAGTPTMTIERVRSFRTPFGSYMIITTLACSRKNASSWDMKDYLSTFLSKNGVPTAIDEIHMPARAARFSE